MPLASLPFAESSYSERIPYFATQYTLNYYPHTVNSPALSQKILKGTPGISTGPEVLTSNGLSPLSGVATLYWRGWWTCVGGFSIGSFGYMIYVRMHKESGSGTITSGSQEVFAPTEIIESDNFTFVGSVDYITVVKFELVEESGDVTLSNSHKFDQAKYPSVLPTDPDYPTPFPGVGQPAAYSDYMGWENLIPPLLSNKLPIGRFIGSANNGAKAVLLWENIAFSFDSSNDTFTEITDADFTANGNPNGVAFVDGYFVFTTDAKKIIVSALNDPTSYNALDFGSAEADPDGCVCPFVYKNQLYIAGERTIEVFNNIGGTEFPFQRVGQFYDVGLLGQRQMTVHESGVYFLGRGRGGAISAYHLDSEPVRITQTPQFELNDTDTVDVEAHSVGGHDFIMFMNRSEPAAVFDITENAWHRRSSNFEYSLYDGAYRPRGFVQVSGFTVVGDVVDNELGYYPSVSGKPVYLGIISSNESIFSEYGEGVKREVTLSPLFNDFKPFSISHLEAIASSEPGGVGTNGLKITVTKNSLDTSVSYEFLPDRSVDFIGNNRYDQARFIWRRLGRFNESTTIKISGYDQYNDTDTSLVTQPCDILQVKADIRG